MIAVKLPRANARLSASSAATLLPFEPYTIETASSSTAAPSPESTTTGTKRPPFWGAAGRASAPAAAAEWNDLMTPRSRWNCRD